MIDDVAGGAGVWFRLSAKDVRQDLFGLTVTVSSPAVSLHGYARKNVQSISCPWSGGVLDF